MQLQDYARILFETRLDHHPARDPRRRERVRVQQTANADFPFDRDAQHRALASIRLWTDARDQKPFALVRAANAVARKSRSK